ncbi:MAG: transposase [Acidimicrobiales bacterium]
MPRWSSRSGRHSPMRSLSFANAASERIRPGCDHAESTTAPHPANSGKVTTHYRLNSCGDRRLSWALHTVVLSRMRCDEKTRAYVKGRTVEGKT